MVELIMLISKSSIDISIIIVNYHSADYVIDCVKSIQEHTTKTRYEIVVVDNASFDGCLSKFDKIMSNLTFVPSRCNLGFGGANNLGALHSKAEILLFINPDTILSGDAIDCLYHNFLTLERPGAVGCRLLNTDGSLQTSCVQAFPTILNQLVDAEALRRMSPMAPIWGNAVLHQGGVAPALVQAVSGACLMMRHDVFDQLGGFSPEYFMYGEDLDLCFKAQLSGYRNYHIREATIIHFGGGSTKKVANNFSIMMMKESVFRFLIKFRGRLYGYGYRTAMSVSAIIRLGMLLVLFPVWEILLKAQDWKSVFRKWRCILEWGLGLKRLSVKTE